MSLEDIGFYTLSDNRAQKSSVTSSMKRCELILTDKCNFKCTYCRGLRKDCKGDIPLNNAKEIVNIWTKDKLENIRFSGGEPALYSELPTLIKYTKRKKVKRIAISTNGYADLKFYKELIKLGVNDYSISLDACCSSVGEKMCGGINGAWEKVVNNIKELSKLTYVTTGMVFTPDNINQTKENIEFAHQLGLSDIRIISSAQYNQSITQASLIDEKIKEVHPILKYRINNFLQGRNVRGIKSTDYHRCPLVLDDSAIAGNYHFPCIIYLREHGKPIGKINANMRKERCFWFIKHDTFHDPICQKNCLDVCVDYNNKWKEYHIN